MSCVIPPCNVRVFGKAVQSLSRIADEIVFLFTEKGLQLKGINGSQSAFTCITFDRHYFTELKCAAQSSSDEFCGIHKVLSRPCAFVFKSLYTTEKSIDHFRLSIDEVEECINFEIKMRHNITKRYSFVLLDTENLQASFDPSKTRGGRLVTNSKTLSTIFDNFGPAVNEITMVVGPSKVVFRSYSAVEDVQTKDSKTKQVQTELSLSTDEFSLYTTTPLTVNKTQTAMPTGLTEYTFCYKDFRSILSFADPTKDIQVYLDKPGRPFMVIIDTEHFCEALFVLATLMQSDDDTESQVSNHSSSIRLAHKPVEVDSKRRKTRHEPESDNEQPFNEISFNDSANNFGNVPITSPGVFVNPNDIPGMDRRSQKSVKNSAPAKQTTQDILRASNNPNLAFNDSRNMDDFFDQDDDNLSMKTLYSEGHSSQFLFKNLVSKSQTTPRAKSRLLDESTDEDVILAENSDDDD